MPANSSQRSQTSRLERGWCIVRCTGCPPLPSTVSRVQHALDEAFDTAYAIRRQQAMAEQAKAIFDETAFDTSELNIKKA